ncbi:hypothetical protein F5883DRAFT_553099 [Diaporthe sp. PMI_573]|nr:hypothetical protein F5883DRAFT_553099 [Diaporthaceae sp. PMI_573]
MEGDAKEDRVSFAELMGFQAMCRDVGEQPGNTLDECKATLRATLVNIVDLIDSHRTGRAVQVWTDFDSFRAYTTRPDKMMPLEEAKEDELLNRRGGSKRVKIRAPSLGAGLDGERERKRSRLEM